MSKVKSKEEAMIPADKDSQAKGHPDKKEYSVKSEISDVMKAPKDSGEKHMGGVHKGGDSHIGNSGMGAARAHLERETERGVHSAMVGGHDCGSHSGKMS